MTTIEKFNAAVNVIRNLPKNGSFQPSRELQLTFYSYFKQATEGPNKSVKPSFWDVPGQIKWTAWKKLGDMPSEEAMDNYIEQLKSIVETMSYNADVESFLTSLGAFYDYVPAHDVDLVLGPVIEKVKSRAQATSDASYASANCSESARKSVDESFPSNNEHLTTSPQFGLVANGSIPHKSDQGSYSVSNDHQHLSADSQSAPLTNGARLNLADTDDEDEFEDPLEVLPLPASMRQNYHLCDAILKNTANILRQDLEEIRDRVRSLEACQAAIENERARQREQANQGQRSLGPLMLAFIVLWPLLTSYLLPRLQRRSS